LTKADDPSGPALDWRSLGKMIVLGVLFAAATVILHPPLPLVLGVELGMTVLVGLHELS
jgi:hypothetical protein